MPALVLFGRRWHVGSDDFVVSSFVDLIIRLAWLIAAVVVFWKNEHNLDCDGRDYIKIFYYGVFILSHLIIILDILLLQNSRKGSIILDSEQRKYVPLILYLRIAAELAEIVWNILGTIALYRKDFHCHTTAEPVRLIEIFLIFNWTILVIQLLYCVYVYDALGRSRTRFDELTDSSHNFKQFMPVAKTKYTKKWQRTCRCMLCSWCCVRDDKVLDSYREIAKLFGTMFAHEGLVTSDCLAALVLLSLKQKENDAKLQEIEVAHHRSQHPSIITKEFLPSGISQPESYKTVDSAEAMLHMNNNEDWKSVKRIENFVRFACAAYGFIFSFTKRNCAMNLLSNCSCCSCLPGKSKPVDVDSDMCCLCCLSGVKTTLENIPFEDIVYASFKDTAFHKPFFVALDHSSQSIVIACRGTLSAKDLLTDLTGWPAHIPGYPESFKAHHGMLMTSMKLRDKLNKMKIIDGLLIKYPNYEIVLTGQSLGAGVATLTSLLLRLQYPTKIKAYVYSAPGGLLSQPAAEHCNDHLITVIYGDDFVSRLGVLQFERLKVNLLAALKECKTPKYRLLLGGYCCCVPTPKLEYISASSTESINDDSSLGSLDSLKETIQQVQLPTPSTEEANNSPTMKPQSIPMTRFPSIDHGMYPPGNICYVTKLPKEHRTLHGPKWRWRWAERHEFDDIIVSRKMITDHIPITMPRALYHLAYPMQVRS